MNYLPFPDKKYQIIYADPPWKYKRNGKFCAGRYYNTMTTEEICLIPVNTISDNNCLLFLWTTNSFLHDAFHVIESWGFNYKTCITWKKHHFGLGYWAWGQTEHCLLAAKGKFPRFKPPLLSTIFEHNKTKHSKKPDEFRNIVSKFPHKNKIELFARPIDDLFVYQGWDVWGNEV
jgi:N6-adenosine-specific RNA methylase IME4